jgi:serine protease AprX
MSNKEEIFERILFGETGKLRRFTQDTPVMLEVWFNYLKEPDKKQDLLITPHLDYKVGELSKALSDRFKKDQKKRSGSGTNGNEKKSARIAYNQASVVAELYFVELIRVALPMSEWWQKKIGNNICKDLEELEQMDKLDDIFEDPSILTKKEKLTPALIWLIKVVGTIEIFKKAKDKSIKAKPEPKQQIEVVKKIMQDLEKVENGPLLFSINKNREAFPAILASVKTVKADASWNLFEANCEGITWAILDSGIDATHPAFLRKDEKGEFYKEAFIKKRKTLKNQTRIIKAYDFSVFRDLTRDDSTSDFLEKLKETKSKKVPSVKSIHQALKNGKEIDWELFTPWIEIPPEEMLNNPPTNKHGTHVAGILGANWPASDSHNPMGMDIRGMCPDINIIDLRVFDDNGVGHEFNVMAALQFVRYLNAHKDYTVVHGVNLSLSLFHDVRNYACGRTPVCEECTRVVGSGVVVVAAAGNLGYDEKSRSANFDSGYRSISITDPGNAGSVITVGATHRSAPHTYGVSFFTSRGPTGDGRIKPDLVAPGEKINSTIPNKGMDILDGTSMAAPHVSGAAALLIARNWELAGQPQRIKEILCKTATDLGREKYFQGYGLVDILRALQSV